MILLWAKKIHLCRPVITCEWCKMPIQNPNMGMVVYHGESSGTPGVAKSYHKGSCDPGTAEPWDELTTVLENLRTGDW